MASKTVAMVARTRAAGSLEILIYDSVGDDMFGGAAVTAKGVRQQLNDAGMIGSIDVRLNSMGGDTSEGFAIYNALREHPASVNIHIDGDAASIASIIAMAGDRRIIASNARVMIHEARTFPMRALDARTLRSTLEQVEAVNQSMVDTYVRHTGQSDEQIREWMAAETWMTAAQAKERGFVDEISGESSEERIAAWAETPLETNMPRGANGDQSMEQLKMVALAVGLLATAGETEVVAKVNELKAKAEEGNKAAKERDDLVLALGVDSIDAATGAIAALHAAKTQNEGLATRIEQLEQAKENDERQRIIASIREDRKCTPAQERDLFPTMSTDALRAFAKVAPRVLGRSEHSEPGSEGAGEPMKHLGKTFAEMRPMERAALMQADRETYNALREDAKAHGLL